MKHQDRLLKTNLTTLAHGVELSTRVIRHISGNDVANSVNGQALTDQDIRNAVTARIGNHLKTAKS